MAQPREKSWLALDIGGSRIRVGAIDTNTRIVAQQTLTWPDSTTTADDDLDLVDDTVRKLLLSGTSPQTPIGIALAALVNDEGIVVDWPNRPSWRGYHFLSEFQRTLGGAAVILSDTHAAALAEWRLGAGRIYKDGLFVSVGTGIGAGLILNGQLHRGRHGWAGELGHNVICADGPGCACGRRGCVQVMASGRALDLQAERRGMRGGGSAVSHAAEQGEGWARQAIIECARGLGQAIANAINLLDLEAVIVGGDLTSSRGYWSALEEYLQHNVIAFSARSIDLVRSELGQDAGLLGAAIYASEMVESK